MVKGSDGVSDLEEALAATVVFQEDPEDRTWMVGRIPTQTLHVRLGDFPTEDLWSLYLGHDRWMDFTQPPAGWKLKLSKRGWPETARPSRPKGEFHE